MPQAEPEKECPNQRSKRNGAEDKKEEEIEFDHDVHRYLALSEAFPLLLVSPFLAQRIKERNSDAQ